MSARQKASGVFAFLFSVSGFLFSLEDVSLVPGEFTSETKHWSLIPIQALSHPASATARMRFRHRLPDSDAVSVKASAAERPTSCLSRSGRSGRRRWIFPPSIWAERFFLFLR